MNTTILIPGLYQVKDKGGSYLIHIIPPVGEKYTIITLIMARIK